MKKIAILGHFAFGTDKANGQTIKTKVVGAELRRQYGDDEVSFYDTMGGWTFLLRLPFVLFTILRNHRNIIITPAFKAICIITPAITLMNLLFRRQVHYVVIGGRLPLLVDRFPLLKPALRRLACIYPETELMANELRAKNIHNVAVMPNCKQLSIISPACMKQVHTPPYKVCTFSRVTMSKGIEDAVNAVRACNKRAGQLLFHLDIYGMVEEKEWFEKLMRNQPETEVAYGGLIPFEKSTETLAQYDAMLFPTYYPGECFAGTLIDALAAGLPTIATDWKSNGEIIEQGKTGFLYATHATDELIDNMMYVAEHQEHIAEMRLHCIEKAANFLPEKVIKTLTDRLA